MSESLVTVLAAACGYFVGSLPSGLIAGKLARGIDVRHVGSRNIGATNVSRALGKKWGLIVLVADIAKGLVPIVALPYLVPGTTTAHQAIAGFAAILGHNFPVWLGFRGGKGVATSLGVILWLGPVAAAIAATVFFSTFAFRRIVSLSSIAAALAFAAAQLAISSDPWGSQNRVASTITMLIPALVIVRHHANIARLIRGEEPSFRFGGGESQKTDTAQLAYQKAEETSDPS